MPLEAIEDANYEDIELILGGGGRTVGIRTLRIPAEIMTRSLNRWFSSPGRPAQRLGQILQPGEKVLFRNPSMWGYIPPILLLAMLARLSTNDDSGLHSGDIGDYMFLSILVAIAVLIYRDTYRWKLVVTDRRLLHRLEYDPARYDEFPLSEVEAVPPSPFGDRLFVKLRGKEVQLPVKGKAAQQIREAIEAAKGAA